MSRKWTIVGLLWFCGFLNYADRQAVFSVYEPIGQEFGISDVEKGKIGTAFMLVYALASPLTGFVVDRVPRRRLIVGGLGIWSAVCALTGTARTYGQLWWYRAAEGLGESFYFPASNSTMADYHGPDTRSRALGIHQTSVYAGTAFGGLLAGFLGQRFGWRSPFWVLGVAGVVYAIALPIFFVEPKRGQADAKAPSADPPELTDDVQPPPKAQFWKNLRTILLTPSSLCLVFTFGAANFVTATLLTWLPTFVKRRFPFLDLTGAAAVASLFMPSANLVGALLGGWLGDRFGRIRGGRARVQATALLFGAPCVFLLGRSESLGITIATLLGIGLCKGIYDANLFASLYDIVPVTARGTTVGVMNTAGWGLGSLAPYAIALAEPALGMGSAIGATAALYLCAAALAGCSSALVRPNPAPFSS